MPPPTAPMRDVVAASDSKDVSYDSNEVKNVLGNIDNNNNNNNNGSNSNNKNNINNNFSSLNKKMNINEGKIYVNNNADSMGRIWGNSESGAGPGGLVVHLSKLAYHTSCYEKLRK